MRVNGKDLNFKEEIRIAELLESLEIRDEFLVVELNGEIVSKDGYDKKLKPDDIVEIVSFVGGG